MNTKEKIKELYGNDLPKFLEPARKDLPAILHVAAVYQDKNSYRIIKVDSPRAPRSDDDFFALNLARARVDAIVTSGKVVRLEEGLSHGLQGSFSESLSKYRKESLGKEKSPYSLIFTRGIPNLESKIFNGDTEPVIYTSTSSYDEIDKNSLKERGILAVDGGDNPTLNEALVYLKKELGVNLVSMEAGPSVSNSLYEDSLVSELMLSVYSGKISPEAIGGEFISPEVIKNNFNLGGSSKEKDGWEFRRYTLK